MDNSEIKELYKEELILIKRIQEFGKQYGMPKDRLKRCIIILLYRVFSNLYAGIILTGLSYKKGNISIIKLSLGLLLRCTFSDCILALYLLKVDNKRAIEELKLKNIEYVYSLFERKEVYKDQVKSVSVDFLDTQIDDLWELTMEDNFLGDLSLVAENGDIQVAKKNKKMLVEEGFQKSKSSLIKDQYVFLSQIEEIKPIVEKLYNYFKYFSQYEHFSERGEGDALAVNNSDNIHYPSSIKALSNGVDLVITLLEDNKS